MKHDKDQKDELEPYKTSDTPFAAFLHLQGMTPITTRDDPNDYKREVFIFIDVPEREQYEEDWKNDKGGYRTYYTSLKIVQHMLRRRRPRK